VDPAELYKHLGKQPELTAPLVQKKDRPEPEASPERQTVDLSSLEPVGTAEAERFRRGNVKADEERRARYPGKKRSRSDSPDTETPEAKRAREARVAAPTMPDERARQKREQEAKLAAGKVAYQEKMAELHAVGTARLEAQGQLRAKEQTQQQQYERGFEFTSKAGIHTEEREKLLKSEVPRQPMPAQKKVTTCSTPAFSARVSFSPPISRDSPKAFGSAPVINRCWPATPWPDAWRSNGVSMPRRT
jgi:hypothetical protein